MYSAPTCTESDLAAVVDTIRTAHDAGEAMTVAGVVERSGVEPTAVYVAIGRAASLGAIRLAAPAAA